MLFLIKNVTSWFAVDYHQSVSLYFLLILRPRVKHIPLSLYFGLNAQFKTVYLFIFRMKILLLTRMMEVLLLMTLGKKTLMLVKVEVKKR